MNFHATPLNGVWIVEAVRHADERGFFARTWCENEFRGHGINPALSQCNISFNHRVGTVRGMHFQTAPHAEAKLVRCTAGAIHDVILDLRVGSPTYLKHMYIVLDAESRRAVYIPEGCAHGFQTLADQTEVFYQMSSPWVAGASGGVRWNDPAFSITWPLPITVIAERDLSFPDYREEVEPT